MGQATGDEQPLIAVTGSSGRLGTAIVQALVAGGMRVRALDIVEGVHDPAVQCRYLDITDRRSADRALQGVDTLIHVAGLHGAHLVAGAPRREIWRTNVEGTWRLFRAASQVTRVIFASSTSVYGPGSPSGPARIIDEGTPLAPEDVYDLSKVLGERMLEHIGRDGHEAVALRLGRFYYGSRGDYHLRKLSTGLDLRDAVAAFVQCVRADALPHSVYCVVSDLELTQIQRERLGTDLHGVMEEVLPGLVARLERMNVPLPERFGKSVSAATLRADTGWRPERNLAWWARELEHADGGLPSLVA